MNRLARETSPYLQQHANNPVDWYSWCDEALEKARREDKPILLSVGYSACHWCHVMAHESFEDPDTAQVMNDLFVNIKVDREERPDIDKVYQLAHQLMTRRPGGWPLNVFLTPSGHIPIFAGTYFPKRPAYNMPAFVEVLRHVATYYHQRKDDLTQHSEAFSDALRTLSTAPAPEPVDAEVLRVACREIEQAFDPEFGGFGQAPKFPHTTTIEFLLRRWASSGKTDEKALHMAEKSLLSMARGGIYDHLGGGFSRYSVDDGWIIPHFEKMLYDNGLMLGVYADAWQATGNPLFEKTAVETANWVMREMQSPEGGYYSSLDADSEGEEGKFYVWRREDVEALLGPDEYAAVAKCYGLDRSPNFEGKWHLYAAKPVEDAARGLGIGVEAAAQRLRDALHTLYSARQTRVRPGRDEKILTSWNALMIRGMAVAARALGQREFLDSAERAFEFLRQRLWQNGRLLATYKDGRAHLNAYLDDYAYLIDAGLELVRARWNTETLEWVMGLADVVLERFEDRTNGGFYFTSDDHEDLLQRPKPVGDEATPAGSAVAALALGRLGLIVGSETYRDAARRAVDAAMPAIRRMPWAHCAFLCAIEEMVNPPRIVVIRGDDGDAWLRALTGAYQPRRLCFAIPAHESRLPGLLAARTPRPGTTAYVCTESACLPPFDALDALESALDQAP